VRSALEQVPGIHNIEIAVDNPDFTISYDPAKVKVPDMLSKLEQAGEPAKKKM